MKIPARHVDNFNIILILLTCILAHLFPFHLVLFSYAILGPAHYLTQISWMHDRRYFANSSLLAPALILLALALTFLYFYSGPSQAVLSAAILSLALGLSLISLLPRQKIENRIQSVVIILFSCWLLLQTTQSILVLAILLPTIIHIFFFTAAFMLAGSLRSRKKSAYVSVIALFACAGTFFLPIANGALTPHLDGLDYFQPLITYLQSKGLSATTDAQLFGFLSYAYTYHYLNWFSKAEIIHWHKIPQRRLQIIVTIYLITFATYLYDFRFGFTLMLALSFVHVMLEFPLNMRTIAGLFANTRKIENN